MREMIGFYNSQLQLYKSSRKKESESPDAYLSTDQKKISWSNVLKQQLKRLLEGEFRDAAMIRAVYRPFSKSWMYYDNHFRFFGDFDARILGSKGS